MKVSLLLFQDLENVQLQLEEVRFFDLFGYSEEAAAWQCFMCNNPEKATGTQGTAGTKVPCSGWGKGKPNSPVAVLIAILH